MRTPIPDSTAAEVLFVQDHTCCVCNERGKQVQIHHIDENPSNHELSNLAVLCFDCHDRTQQRGGFGRKLSASEIRRYRDEWLKRIIERRAKADQIAAARGGGGDVLPQLNATPTEWRRPPELLLKGYVRNLPDVRKDAYASVRKLWSSPNTHDMVQGCYTVTDVMEQVWCHLASWFPPRHFGGQPPDKYINDYLATRHAWHRALAEPRGQGSGGTIVRIEAAHGVMSDAENMIRETVEALCM
jgi:hypothetical protein